MLEYCQFLKKWDRARCENYWGVCLLNEGYTLFPKIITA
jgi:hypothetical protein